MHFSSLKKTLWEERAVAQRDMGTDGGFCCGDGPRTPDAGGAGSKVTDASITYKRVTFLKNSHNCERKSNGDPFLS